VQDRKHWPQFVAELRVATHSPLQHLNPLAVSQALVQFPQEESLKLTLMQVELQQATEGSEQSRSQPPQSVVEPTVSTHSELQQISPFATLQLFMQLPQVSLLKRVSVQFPLQQLKPGWLQALKHPPQCTVEFKVSTQPASQHWRPLAVSQLLVQLPQEVSF
jgi:hypothetical protein